MWETYKFPKLKASIEASCFPTAQVVRVANLPYHEFTSVVNHPDVTEIPADVFKTYPVYITNRTISEDKTCTCLAYDRGLVIKIRYWDGYRMVVTKTTCWTKPAPATKLGVQANDHGTAQAGWSTTGVFSTLQTGLGKLYRLVGYGPQDVEPQLPNLKSRPLLNRRESLPNVWVQALVLIVLWKLALYSFSRMLAEDQAAKRHAVAEV